jgi:hypothetical protein
VKAGIGISISVGIIAVLVLLARSPRNDQKLVGFWQGDRDWKELHLDNESVARSLSAIDLTLKLDGSFLLKDGQVPFTGPWIQRDKAIELQVETIMNKPIEQQPDSVKSNVGYMLRVDGAKLFFKKQGDDLEIELKKQSKP